MASEQPRSARHVAPGNLLANERARDHFSPANHRRKDHNFESVLREAPEHLERGGELLTCFPVREETARFESLLRERFRYRQLPETQDERRNGFALRSYLAMKL